MSESEHVCFGLNLIFPQWAHEFNTTNYQAGLHHFGRSRNLPEVPLGWRKQFNRGRTLKVLTNSSSRHALCQPFSCEETASSHAHTTTSITVASLLRWTENFQTHEIKCIVLWNTWTHESN